MSLLADPATIWTDDEALVSIANRKRILLSESPTQSCFRVFCILVVETNGKMQFVDGKCLCSHDLMLLSHHFIGANSEQGYIGGKARVLSSVILFTFILRCNLC
jgi:hypothetical protein